MVTEETCLDGEHNTLNRCWDLCDVISLCRPRAFNTFLKYAFGQQGATSVLGPETSPANGRTDSAGRGQAAWLLEDRKLRTGL